jgi:FkbM family methyltransferase
MSRVKASVKALLERRAPVLLDWYWRTRIGWVGRPTRPRPSAHGFLFGGSDAMATGRFESEETALLTAFLPHVDTVVDVGANVGLFTCLARSNGKRVVAVEPVAANLSQLYANLLANGWDDVEVFPLALGARAGLVTIYGSGVGASAIPGWSGAARFPAQVVPVATLDVILSERRFRERLFVKVDVEGLELQVLGGAQRVLEREPAPVWLVEIGLSQHHPGGRNEGFAATFDCFFSAGYTACVADSGRRRVTKSDIERWTEAGKQDFGHHNFLFLRGEAAVPSDGATV